MSNSNIYSGKFGKCGKMTIKEYSVPEDKKLLYIKALIKLLIQDENGCWLWQGRVHNGYACFPCPGGNTKWAHRVSYALFKGKIEVQRHIDHKCRNRLCVNPDHLKQVTPIENYEAIQRRKRKDIKILQEKAGQKTIYQLL